MTQERTMQSHEIGTRIHAPFFTLLIGYALSVILITGLMAAAWRQAV